MKKWLRTSLILFGWFTHVLLAKGSLGYGEEYEVIKGNFVYTYRDIQPSYYIYYAVGTIAILAGCYIWTRLKKRHWAFTLWGILSPIGLLGISLLKDKSNY